MYAIGELNTVRTRRSFSAGASSRSHGVDRFYPWHRARSEHSRGPICPPIFEFVLAWSGYRFVQIAYGETFEALLRGIQGALWKLGGVPEVLRLDNLSAATHELKSGGRELTRRFDAVVSHYGVRASRIQPGKGNQNGVVERAHGLLKATIIQTLLLRGSRDFPTVEAYADFVQRLVDEKFHRPREARIAEELALLRPLPSAGYPSTPAPKRVFAGGARFMCPDESTPFRPD